MTKLTFTFLGTFKVTAAAGTIRSFRTDKMRALLTYLVLEPPHSHRRERLAALLWPESDHKNALYNLRLTLHRLRQALREALPDSDAIFTITRGGVEFHPEAVQSDADRFQQLLATSAAHPHSSLADCESCIEHLQQAVDLYHGELLAGMGIPDAPAFEEWLLLRRETLQHLMLSALHQLVAAYEARGNHERALEYARRKLNQDLSLEESHVQVIRILAQLGHVGQALIQYERCRQYLNEMFGMEPSLETEALVEQIRDRAVTPASAQATGQPPLLPPHNLPAQLTSFFGRRHELQELMTFLQQPGRRLVTLVGPGGMGKTRLALEVAQRLLTSFSDGVFFVPLAALTDPSTVASAIATALDLTITADLPQALYGALRSKHLLLILDNCEQLLPTALTAQQHDFPTNRLYHFIQLVTELLQHAPNVRILATSRERLNLRAEWLYPIEGVDFVPTTETTAAAEMAAVRLFVESAQRFQPDFRLQAAELAGIMRVCTIVRGMPLGLELAAAWTDQLSPAKIARQIEQNAAFLAVEWHDLPDRQRSMRAVFAWSWQLLTRAEQQTLQQLAIFRGDFAQAAATAITEASFPLLTSLQHKSLVHSLQTPPEIAAAAIPLPARRYQLHELLRQFAEEALKEDPTHYAQVAMRHSRYYLHFVAEREIPLARHQAHQTASEIQTEISNIHHAWGWAVEHQQFALLDQSAYGLWQFYILRGMASEAEHLFQSATAMVRSAIHTDTEVDGRHCLLGKLLAMRAYLFNRQNQQDQANLLGNEAALLYQTHLADLPEAHPQWHTSQEVGAFIACIQGLMTALRMALEPARHLLQQALTSVAGLRQRGPVSEFIYDVEWMSHLYLGVIARAQDDSASASTQVQRAATLCQQWGKLRGQINCLANLAAIELLAGNYESAHKTYTLTLSLSQSLHYRRGEATQLSELGCTLRELGDYGSALEKLERSWALYQQMGSKYVDSFMLAEFIRLESYLGRFERAHQWLAYCNSLGKTDTNFYTDEEKWLSEAVLALQQADYAKAATAATTAWGLVREAGTRALKGQSQILLGHAYVGLEQWATAQAAYQEALHHYLALGRVSLIVEAQAGLAAVASAQDQCTQALALVEEILPIFEKQPQFGLHEPFQVYLTCYRTLAAQHDERAAPLLQRAQAHLHLYVRSITDPALRHSFLENVPLHRIIRTLHHAN